MLTRILLFVLVFSTACGLLADYVSERDAAMKLFWAGKYEEAMAAFTKIAAGAKSDVQKSDALEQAVQCAIALKKYEQAAELAKQIPLAPVAKTCQMRIMSAKRQWKELVAKFKDEDIDAWPEDIKGDAFHLRGCAYYNLKDGKNAEADLKRACDWLYEENSKGLALNALGDTYQFLLNDDQRAIETYRSAYQNPALYKQCQAAISCANVFKKLGKFDDALQELGKIDMSKVTVPYWRATMLAAYADVLARQGKKTEAISKYTEALHLPDIHPSQKAAYEKELKQLQTDAR